VASIGDSPGEAGDEASPEGVADPGGIEHGVLLGAPDLDDGLSPALDARALVAQRGDPALDALEDLRCGPAGLLLGERGLVLVREEIRGSVDELADLGSVHARQLLRRVGGEGVATLAALVGVTQHAIGIGRTDDDEIGLADALHDRQELDVARLAHRTGIEGSELVRLDIRRADETSGVVHLAHVHGVGVDAVTLQP
jgi:hypothetical protein